MEVFQDKSCHLFVDRMEAKKRLTKIEVLELIGHIRFQKKITDEIRFFIICITYIFIGFNIK